MIRITMEFEFPDLNELIIQTAGVVGVFGSEDCEVTKVSPGDPAKATVVRTFESSSQMFEVLGQSLVGDE